MKTASPLPQREQSNNVSPYPLNVTTVGEDLMVLPVESQ